MAKQKGENKSQAVRDLLAKNPKMAVKEVVAALKEKGIEVSSNLVYIIKGKTKRKARREKREQAIAAGKSVGISNPVDLILEARQLAEKAGGIKHLKALVDALAG